MIAVPEEFSSEWQDPAYLEVLSRTAFRFTLSPGERRTVELSVQDVRPPGIGREPVIEVPAPGPSDLWTEDRAPSFLTRLRRSKRAIRSQSPHNPPAPDQFPAS